MPKTTKEIESIAQKGIKKWDEMLWYSQSEVDERYNNALSIGHEAQKLEDDKRLDLLQKELDNLNCSLMYSLGQIATDEQMKELTELVQAYEENHNKVFSRVRNSQSKNGLDVGECPNIVSLGRSSPKSEDVSVELPIASEGSIPSKPNECPNCAGYGHVQNDAHEDERCETCNGTGISQSSPSETSAPRSSSSMEGRDTLKHINAHPFVKQVMKELSQSNPKGVRTETPVSKGLDKVSDPDESYGDSDCSRDTSKQKSCVSASGRDTLKMNVHNEYTNPTIHRVKK